jgi:hypothetical protein
MFRMVLILLFALGISLQIGCASGPRVPPAEFDLGSSRIDAAAVEPPQVSPGPHGKVAGAVYGSAVGAAAWGLSFGIMAALPCVFLGPYAPACFAAVGPAAATGVAAGGVTGAAVGAGTSDRADSPEQAAAKRELLVTALAKLKVQELLIDRLQRITRESAMIELPVVDPDAHDTTAKWRIAIEIIDIAPAQNGSDDPYALLASASLAVIEESSGVTVFQKRYQALSPEKQTTTEWGKDNAAAVRIALDGLMNALADQMFSNLSREELTRGGVLWGYSHYRQDFLSRMSKAIITNVDGIEYQDRQPIQLPSGRHLVEVQYLRQSLLCGYLGCIDFEQERRSFELRVEAGHSYMPFAIQHCDKAWMGIVDTGKSAKDDHTSEEAMGFWQFGDLTRDASTHVAVAGKLPPLTCEEN